MIGLTHDRVTRLDAKREGNKKSRTERVGEEADCSSPERHPTILDFRHNAGPLARTVQTEVIPRLMVAHRHSGGMAPAVSAGAESLDRADVVEFTALVANGNAVAAHARIETKRAQGVTLEALYLDLLIPSARRLSDLWEADLCHYEEIAIGMLHLQQVLHDLSPAFSSEARCQSRGLKALLVSAPAEQNMLGVYMVSEFCRCVVSEFYHRAGWEVCRTPPASRQQLFEVLRTQRFDVVDISASCDGRLAMLAVDIGEMRRVSRNRELGVVVDGPVFYDDPALLVRVGADGAASDARDALSQAEAVVERRLRADSQPYY